MQKNLILYKTQKSRRTKHKKAEEQNTKKVEETEEKRRKKRLAKNQNCLLYSMKTMDILIFCRPFF
ncbi:hypothetical protein HMPREF6123_0241 [Oribacterium sinus F0268]|uniref:Uncharacterized protein n=1 Tax=Oribacterium sinus F0268 TaxID=585501 RepID=C2KUS2_9FIRM|nr:hypothetical protein HMPREF6123_0241 [Oribacterium sinus F0268]